jgi:hypothetical protein
MASILDDCDGNCNEVHDKGNVSRLTTRGAINGET